MPAIAKNSHILVTGASGFLAIQCVKAALNAGHRVTGTVRDSSKGEYIKKAFGGQPFDYVVVEDIEQEGAFDNAVQHAQFSGILHTASPFHYNTEDPDEIIKPAVQGTIGILESTAKHAPSVSRISITSSNASIVNTNIKPPHTYDESQWNTTSAAVCKEKGKDAPNAEKYRASKVLAERAAWKWVEENKPKFDITTILPVLIFGEMLQDVPDKSKINTSTSTIFDLVKGKIDKDSLPGPMGSFVDVEDVAKAHLKSLEIEKAGGERYYLTNGPLCKADLVSAIRKIDPSSSLLPVDEEAAKEVNSPQKAIQYDHSKVVTQLGLEFTTLEESMRRTLRGIQTKEQQWSH